MEKLTINISPSEWGHLITKYSASSSALALADFSAGTVNVETDSTGNLTKRKGGPNYNSALLGAAPKDQFEAIFSDGARHLLVVAAGTITYSSGDNIFNAVTNGSGFSSSGNFEFATTQDRVYGGNGINSPIVYDRTAAYGGSTPVTVPFVKNMGLLAPGSAATATAAATGAVPVGNHTYKITFVYYDSEESNGSSASNSVTVAANERVNLTAVPLGGYGVTARKIYRDFNADQLYLHVGTISDNTTTTFADVLVVGVTPTEIPTDHDAPPIFSRITNWLDQLWVSGAAGDPSVLFYSDTAQPDVFPSQNQVLCNSEDPITGHIVYFDRLMVFNRRSMGQILGKSSDQYRYAAIPSSVGCVDNRTIQIRVISGVPVIVWLSDRGFYRYDGNAIDYISDEIEDLVNFNIQQALQQKNSISQSSFSGTAEDGITLTEVPGSVTTRGYFDGAASPGTNPRRNWDDNGDWESAAPLNVAWTPISNTNTRTKDGDNALRVPTRFTVASFAEGSHAGTQGTTSLILPTAIFSTGESAAGVSIKTVTAGTKWASRFVPTASGAVSSPSLSTVGSPVFEFYTDSGGLPGVNLGATTTVVSGTAYWVVASISTTTSVAGTAPNGLGFVSGGNNRAFFNGSSWSASGALIGAVSFSLCATPISSSGQWTSPIYDTKSAFISTGLTITHTGAYTGSACSGAASMTGQTIVEGSDLATFSGGAQITQTISNLNGTSALTLSGKRYWRLKIALASSDSRVTPTIGLPILAFTTTATWESETIDTTLQSTAYNSLVTSSTVPGGTSVTTTIATSTSGTGPWTFVTFGSHVVRQFVRIRVVLVADGTDTTTPIVNSVVLKWTVSAKYTSTIIDTGLNPPAGWDLFLADFTLNGGTAVFEMRSATTSPGITGATFYTVTSGNFPAVVLPNQFTQWRVTITSADEDVPQVDSVTIQWFISSITSLRPASIFVDGRYYVALAEVGSLFNNVLLEIDLKGKWRRLAGLNIATFSFFFNRPYFGLATSGQIRKFLDGVTDAGTAIEFDYRTKAFDFSTQYQNNSSKIKVVAEVILNGVNTGATYQVFYSIDEGETFYPMYTNSGLASYVSGTDESEFFVRVRALWADTSIASGRTIMYRVYSNDINDVTVIGLEVTATSRQQPPVITG